MKKCCVCGNEILDKEEKKVLNYSYHKFCYDIIETETAKTFPRFRKLHMEDIVKKCKQKYNEIRGLKENEII